MEPTFFEAAGSRTLRVKLSADSELRWRIFQYGLQRRLIYPSLGARGPYTLVQIMTELGEDIEILEEDTADRAKERIRSRVKCIAEELRYFAMSDDKKFA